MPEVGFSLNNNNLVSELYARFFREHKTKLPEVTT